MRDPAEAALWSVPSAIVALDTDGQITMTNAAAESILGISSAAVLGQPYTTAFGPSLSDRLFHLFRSALRTGGAGEPALIEATLPTGRRTTLRANMGILRDAYESIVGLLLVAEEAAEVEPRTAEGGLETDRLREALRRYLGASVASFVESRPSFVGVGGVRQMVSVVHADVRGYTTIAEELDPEDVTALLLSYHGAAVSALQSEGATLDRFIGDSVLALWNAPTPRDDHANAALKGALALRDATRVVGDQLAYGVGVHTGEAVVGNLGSDQFMNYTAIGDTVNVAARLQSAAAAGQVLCSAALLDLVGTDAEASFIGDLEVKGRRNLVPAYEVLRLQD